MLFHHLRNPLLLALAAFFAAFFLLATPQADADSISSQSVSSQTISQQSVEKASISQAGVSTPSVSGAPGSKPSQYTHGQTNITQVHGSAQGRVVLPPFLFNTYEMRAEYLTPNPKSESQPFLVRSETVRLPLANNGPVYWLPNAKSIIVDK